MFEIWTSTSWKKTYRFDTKKSCLIFLTEIPPKNDQRMFKLSCIPFFQRSPAATIYGLSPDILSLHLGGTTRCPLCTTRLIFDSTDVFATFFNLYLKFPMWVVLHHGVFFPQNFCSFWNQVKRRKTDKNEVSGLANNFLPSKKRSHIPQQQVLCLVVSLFTISGPGSTDIYTALKIEIYNIHVFFSKIVVYRFYDLFGDTTI